MNTYNPGIISIFHVIDSNLTILLQSLKIRNVLGKSYQRNSKRQEKINFKRLPTRGKFTSENETEVSLRGCGDRICGICNHRNNCKAIGGDQPHKIQEWSFIKSKYGYELQDAKPHTRHTCKENYIGKTSHSFCQRTNVHRQHIRQEGLWKILQSKHLKLCGKNKCTIFPFYK